MTYIITFLVFVSLAYALNTCREFICKNPVDPNNPQICAHINKTNSQQWTEYVGTCPANNICRLKDTDYVDYSCINDPDFLCIPGQKCARAGLCFGKIINGICRGKAYNEICDNHIDCDVGLYCGLERKCVKALNEGEKCSENELCQSYLTCHEGKCVVFGYIENGYQIDNPDLCRSHYINKNGVCDEGPELKGEIFRDNTDEICLYSDGTETKPVCGYHSGGKAICKPGESQLKYLWNDLF